MLKIHPELDAIIAAMDAQGIGALRALKEARKKVPGDVRVISLTGHELGSMLETTMTTMEMPAVEIGKKQQKSRNAPGLPCLSGIPQRCGKDHAVCPVYVKCQIVKIQRTEHFQSD